MESDLHFKVEVKTQLNQFPKIVGSIPGIGSWDPIYGLILYTNEKDFPIWRSLRPIKVKSNIPIEFKIVLYENGVVKEWESFEVDNNRIIIVNEPKMVYVGIFKNLQGTIMIDNNSLDQKGKNQPKKSLINL